jgi:hypothetical protein
VQSRGSIITQVVLRRDNYDAPSGPFGLPAILSGWRSAERSAGEDAVQSQADREGLGGDEPVRDGTGVLVAEFGGEVALDQCHWVIEVHDPVVRDTRVGVLTTFDHMVSAV